MNNNQFQTPILLVVFNRPKYTELVFDAIRKQKPVKLFIAADGPRAGNLEDAEKCREVRRIVSNIDWSCEVKTLFRDKNLGFSEGERTAFEWFFDNVEEGIILEDDGLPHPDFFRFASEMLAKYRYNDQVMMITGNNFVPDFKTDDSYFFSNFFAIWGWASWRRVWKQYDMNINSWSKPESKAKLKTLYTQKFMFKHMEKLFNDIYQKKTITWDAQLLYLCVMNSGLCVTPANNLVSNIGLDGTHSEGHNQNLSTKEIYKDNKLIHPKLIAPSTAYDHIFYERSFYPAPFSFKKVVVSILVKSKTLKYIYRLFIKKTQVDLQK